MTVKTCKNCLMEFEVKDSRQKYCSNSCSAIVSNKKRVRKRKIRSCKFCGSSFTGHNNKKMCSTCYASNVHVAARWKDKKEEINNQTIAEIKLKYKYSRWTDVIRNNARRKYNRSGLSCRCGYSKHVEICHVKPIAAFPDTALICEVNAESNILFLCPNCHWEFDNERWLVGRELNPHVSS